MDYRVLLAAPLILAFAVSSSITRAAPVNTPCELVDREMIDVLRLGDAKSVVEHKTLPATKESPQQSVDLCTIVSDDAPYSTLGMSATALPPGGKDYKLFCSERSFAAVKVSVCNTSVSGVGMTFALATPGTVDESVHRTFRFQLERRVRQLESAPGMTAR